MVYMKLLLCSMWQVAFVLFSQFLLKWLSLTAARFLHNSMLKQLLRCGPTTWCECVGIIIPAYIRHALQLPWHSRRKHLGWHTTLFAKL